MRRKRWIEMKNADVEHKVESHDVSETSVTSES